MTRTRGEKFVDKYGVETYQIYKGNPETIRIPGPDHPLYDPTSPNIFDEFQVQQIDADGKMSTAVEVFTDPDSGILWAVDGRRSLLNLREVNRRRRADGREEVKAFIIPFSGDEKAAVMRVRIKNYHRRVPQPSDMAMDIKILRARGCTWDVCAQTLHVTTDDAEQWGRKLLPLAYCIEEVRAAIDSGEIPRGKVSKFGGTALDGSKALSRKEQLASLAEVRATESTKGSAATITVKQRERVHAALTNGAVHHLRGHDKLAADVIAATLAFIGGDPKALKEWPDAAAVVAEALKPLPKGPKPKKEKKSK